MSVQFGRWKFDGETLAHDRLLLVQRELARYGPDGSKSYSGSGVDILYGAFHTTKESRLEVQPYITTSGLVVTWDGRLDNRLALISRLDNGLSTTSPDVLIVATAYERWGECAFARLIGDWALCLWNPQKRTLILCKDPIGTRQLYYSVEKDQVIWSTILDPLLLTTGRSILLNEEYIAGWLSSFPAAHLSPYVGIQAVAPSSYVRVTGKTQFVCRYWDFDPSKAIRYRTDVEYQEHFLAEFENSIRRRLRSDTPVLAELSGGMDSSSIVCMADAVISRGLGQTPRLDTVSYYDDLEPNWNERPYFTIIEEKRGRVGCHINVGSNRQHAFKYEEHWFASTPGSGNCAEGGAKQLFEYMTDRNRVLLSGTGGDEVLGGVPSPTLELADLLIRGRVSTFLHQLVAWALAMRRPVFHLVCDTMRVFLPVTKYSGAIYKQPPAWLTKKFATRNREALCGYDHRLKIFGALPTFQEMQSTLDAIRRQLACTILPSEPPYEKRYPYLDRDLLEFLFAIPREQMVRPNQRRSLMRRALSGIVPHEILQRRRKAFVDRGAMNDIAMAWTTLVEKRQRLEIFSLGIADEACFLDELRKARQGLEICTGHLMRTLGIEFWLRGLRGDNPKMTSLFRGEGGAPQISWIKPTGDARLCQKFS
jgi:asparagine synthase (glutamine-hydrolysing)